MQKLGFKTPPFIDNVRRFEICFRFAKESSKQCSFKVYLITVPTDIYLCYDNKTITKIFVYVFKKNESSVSCI